MRCAPIIAAAVAALAPLAWAQSAPSTIQCTPLILSGQPAPGAGAGVIFGGPGIAAVNSAGQILFEGFLSGPGITEANTRGFWAGTPDSLQLVARQGSSAPGAELSYRHLGLPYLDESGRVAFLANLATPDGAFSAGNGIWAGDPASPQLIAREEDPVPGMPDYRYRIFRDIQCAGGQVMVVADLSGPPANAGNAIFVAGTTLQTVAVAGSTAPGLPPDTRLGRHLSHGSINASGQVAFHATLEAPGIDPAHNTGVWVGTPASLQLAARTGTPAVGMGDGLAYGYINPPTLNATGQIAFQAQVNEAATGNHVADGIWAGTPNSLALIARTGEHAPGLDNQTTFSGFYLGPRMNSAGEVAFGAFAYGPDSDDYTDQGIWMGRPDQLRPIAREGDHAPGTPLGVQFSQSRDDHEHAPFDTLLMNDLGQLAFVGRLAGEGVTPSNDEGIWAMDINGQVSLIAREGGEMDLGGGDRRTIQWLQMASLTDPNSGSFGNNGLFFTAYFTDGSSGIFRAVVPEPMTLPWLAAAAALLLRRRRN